MTRTYDRETYLRAKAAWDEGEFGPEWNDLRRLSWDHGYPYPPVGTRHDDREAAEPSQRAIVYHALLERPQGTRNLVASSRSWSQVVARIIAEEDWLREGADHLQADADSEREERPSHREAASRLATILERIAVSRGIEP